MDPPRCAVLREIAAYAQSELEQMVLYSALRPVFDMNEFRRRHEEMGRLLARELRDRERRELMRIPGAERIAVLTLLTRDRRLALLDRFHDDSSSLFSILSAELLCELEGYFDHSRDRIVYDGVHPVLLHEGHPFPDTRRGDMLAVQYAQCVTVSRVREVEARSPPHPGHGRRSPLPPKPRPRRECRPRTMKRGRQNHR